jgi:hypothetical protein
MVHCEREGEVHGLLGVDFGFIDPVDESDFLLAIEQDPGSLSQGAILKNLSISESTPFHLIILLDNPSGFS